MRRALLIWLVLILAAASAAVQTGAASETSASSADRPGTEPTVNLELKDVDVRAAIEALFRNSGKNFSIDSNVSGTVPAVSFKDVPFDTALRNLTKTAGLVFRVDNSAGREIYIISKKPETPLTVGGAGAGGTQPFTDLSAGVIDQPTEREVVIEKIPLFHTGASEMLAMLGGSGREYGGLGIYGTGLGGYGYPGYGGYGSYYGGYPGYGSYGRYRSYGYGGYGGYPSYGGYGGYPGYGSYGIRTFGGYGNYPAYGGYPGYGGYGTGMRSW